MRAVLTVHGPLGPLESWPSLENCQNGTFEPLHEIQKKISAKSILLKHYENGNKKKYS